MIFITHGFRVSVVSDVRQRVRDFRITFALYSKKIFISSSVFVCYTERAYKASILFYSSVCPAMFVKKSEVHILYLKELTDARILRAGATWKASDI